MKTMLRIMLMATFVIGTFAATEAMAGAEKKCKACHDFGTKSKVGPGLAGVFDREAGATSFKKYSASMKKGGWVWNEENLRTYLSNTKKGIKKITGDDGAKTKMASRLRLAKWMRSSAFSKA